MKKDKRYYFRNIISWFLMLSMMLGTMQTPEFALVVQAEEPGAPGDPEAGQTQTAVSYLDESGEEQTCESAAVLSGNETSLEPGWYVVNSDRLPQLRQPGYFRGVSYHPCGRRKDVHCG